MLSLNTCAHDSYGLDLEALLKSEDILLDVFKDFEKKEKTLDSPLL